MAHPIPTPTVEPECELCGGPEPVDGLGICIDCVRAIVLAEPLQPRVPAFVGV